MSLYIITRCLCEEPKSHLWPGPVRGVPRAGSRRSPTRLKGLTGSSSFNNFVCLISHLIVSIWSFFPCNFYSLSSFDVVLVSSFKLKYPAPLLQVSQFMFGGLAGTLCWLSVLPFDVVKSRMQVGQPQFLIHRRRRKK